MQLDASFTEWEWVTVLRISRTEPQFRTRDPDEWEVITLLHRRAQRVGLPECIPAFIRKELEKFLAEWAGAVEQVA